MQCTHCTALHCTALHCMTFNYIGLHSDTPLLSIRTQTCMQTHKHATNCDASHCKAVQYNTYTCLQTFLYLSFFVSWLTPSQVARRFGCCLGRGVCQEKDAFQRQLTELTAHFATAGEALPAFWGLGATSARFFFFFSSGFRGRGASAEKGGDVPAPVAHVGLLGHEAIGLERAMVSKCSRDGNHFDSDSNQLV